MVLFRTRLRESGVLTNRACPRGLDIAATQSDGEIQAKLSLLIGEITVKMQHSPDDRKQLRAHVHEQMTQLITDMDWIVQEAEAVASKRLLIIIEDLDKVDLQAATRIFHGHAASLNRPTATIIYTFPVALRYSAHYGIIRENFNNQVFTLHNIHSHQRNEDPDSQGIAALCDIVRKRLEEHLIDDGTLRGIAFYSGGIPASLVFLVRSAALYALSRDPQARSITREDAERAFKDLREHLLVPLNERDVEVLYQRHQDHRLTNDADDQQVLYKGALVEYRGKQSGAPWCDAHPLLWYRLRQAERDRDASPTEDPV